MELQNAFYIVGIICMTLYTILLVALVVLLFYIRKRVNEVTAEIENKVSEFRSFASNPGGVIADLGANVVEGAVNKAIGSIKRKKILK